MKILLHAPLHPSLWIYLMDSLPEHSFYIEPSEDFQQDLLPRQYLNYQIVSEETAIADEYDVQILCLHLGGSMKAILKVMESYNLPTVFVEFGKIPLADFKIKYPMIYLCKTNYNDDYPNTKHIYFVPSRKIWDKDWKGDQKKVFLRADIAGQPMIRDLVTYLKQKDINFDQPQNRKVSWTEWKNFFIHDRVHLDLARTPMSFTTVEALTVGMPVIVGNWNEFPLVIRHNVDGFSKWDKEELLEMLERFITDDNFAKTWSLRSRARGIELLDLEKQRETLNESFQEAIHMFNNPPKSPKKDIQKEKELVRCKFCGMKNVSKEELENYGCPNCRHR